MELSKEQLKWKNVILEWYNDLPRFTNKEFIVMSGYAGTGKCHEKNEEIEIWVEEKDLHHFI